MWQAVTNIGNLRDVIVETAFPDSDERLAVFARHWCPRMLGEQRAQLNRPVEILITYLNSGEGEKIMQEVCLRAKRWQPRPLQRDQVFEF